PEATEEPAAEEPTATEAVSEADETPTPEPVEEEATAGTDSAETEEAGQMDDMMGTMSAETMEMITAAMEAGEAGDWEAVVTHMNHLIEMTDDADHRSEMVHLLEEITAGNTDHFADEMQAMMDTMMGTMPKMTGTMSDEAMEMMNAAMTAAQADDWELVATHMNHVLDISTDAQQKSAIEHLLEEVEEGNTDHFIAEMEEMMSSMMQVSPAMENMQAAMTAAQAGDWDIVQQEMESAIDISTDPLEKSSLEHLIEEIAEGNTDHFIEQLGAVMQGEEAAHE
ncbi:MAG: hypothetical protein KDE31_00885, partial [Caldilineaceae bacterium]|nr:hypothetical protein [Caldilineaceae bacterium]